MKALILALFATSLLLCAESKNPEREIAPHTFDSTAEAEAFAKQLFAGGEVRVFDIQNTNILVLHVFGSGVYDLAVLAYSQEGKCWRLEKTWQPQSVQPYRVEVIDDGLFVVGEKTGERWEIFRVKIPEAYQPSPPMRGKAPCG